MRKKRKFKKQREPDIKYNSITISRFINYLMEDGKKSVAEDLIYGAFDIIAKNVKDEPLAVFEKALENASPFLEVV